MVQRTASWFTPIVTDKFMPKVSLFQNRVPQKVHHKCTQGHYSMLEPDEGKLSRPVLRAGGGSNPASLTRRDGWHITRRASELTSRRCLGTRTRGESIQKVLQMAVALCHWCSLPREGIDRSVVSCSQQVVGLLTGRSYGL